MTEENLNEIMRIEAQLIEKGFQVRAIIFTSHNDLFQIKSINDLGI